MESINDTLKVNSVTMAAFAPGLFTEVRESSTRLELTATIGCLQMNDVLWEFRRDATTRTLVMTIFASLYTLIIICGVIGNVCVILAISRTRALQTVPNMFIFSLSCSDVVVCFTSATITPITAFRKEWIFGSFLCSVAPFIAGVSLCFSTFTLAAISLDRFMLIRFPMKKPFSHAQAFFLIFLICVFAMGLSMPIVFMQTLRPLEKYCGEFCYEDWGASNSQRRAYGTLMLILQFIIPLAVIVFCYTAISIRLGQSVILKGKNEQSGSYNWQLQISDQQRVAAKRRQRTNRMFIGMVVAFSLSWIWTLVFNLLRDYEILPSFVKSQEFFFGILTHAIAMTSTVWNPILYALLNLQLRAAFIQLTPKWLKRCCSVSLCCFRSLNSDSKTKHLLSANHNRLPNQSTVRQNFIAGSARVVAVAVSSPSRNEDDLTSFASSFGGSDALQCSRIATPLIKCNFNSSTIKTNQQHNSLAQLASNDSFLLSEEERVRREEDASRVVVVRKKNNRGAMNTSSKYGSIFDKNAE